MKKILISTVLCFFVSTLLAQKESFDIASFTAPKGWKKLPGESAVQFTKEDAAKGTFCLITLYKAVPGTPDSKENFNLAWSSIIKEMVTVATDPVMEAPENADGWEVHSGYAPFEKDETKGVVILVTTSGFEKMVNLVILTNTDVYEKQMTAFIESIKLKKPATGLTKTNNPVTKPSKSLPNKPAAVSGGYAFNTTNFDDGWVATEQTDWVEVKKGNIKVLIHYPKKSVDDYNPDLLGGFKNAWDILVAPRYSSASNMEFKPISGWQPLEFAEADMVEKGSNSTVHVVLFKMNYSNGNGRYMEFITPDKATYEQEFGVYQQSTSAFKKTEKMLDYNKFAVAASDLRGEWTNNFTGTQQYVNAYTGNDAGMATHASNENFVFGPGNSYKWNLGVASGFVGNIKFQGVKSSGKFTMDGNWKINFSDLEGKPRKKNIHFTCLKGARILWIDDTAFGRVN